MKANEAPEKLYVDATDNPNDVWLRAFRQPFKKCGVEYTRTDAFIEKAWEWLRFNRWKYEDSREGNEAMEKDFKNYMKGEDI